ncbi:MAG: hypothetical protein Q4G07_04785 [Oscillospiraceae bacterium]|nr:hypothetical protein [Oscillospiraceae bacterium]
MKRQARECGRLCRALLWFLPLAVLLVGVNLVADPANLYQANYEKAVTDILLSGQNAEGVENMDDRKFMTDFLTRYSQPVDTLVVGSSHALQITRALDGDPTLINAGVTNADIRDMMSWYLLLEEKGMAPKKVIWVADCWHIATGSMDGRARTQEYAAFMKQRELPVYPAQDKTLQKLEELVSPAYFQSGVALLAQGGKTKPQATLEQYGELDMRRADGSYCYNRAYREAPQQEKDGQAYNLTVRMPQFARGFDGHSPVLETELRAFFDHLKEQNVAVTLLLSPFHPDFYAYMKKTGGVYDQLLAEEDFYRSLGEEYGFDVYGSYDPSQLGLKNTDFYDGIHCTDEAMYSFYPRTVS